MMNVLSVKTAIFVKSVETVNIHWNYSTVIDAATAII